MDSVFDNILNKASSITESDIDSWVLDIVISYFSPQFGGLAMRAFGSNYHPVARAAFEEHAKKEMKAALRCFFLKKKHYEAGRSLTSYLRKTLTRLTDRIYWEQSSHARTSLLICPGCRLSSGDMNCEFLNFLSDSKLWECQHCSREAARLEGEIKNLKQHGNSALVAVMEGKVKQHKVFSRHSRRGYKCPDCTKFIPESTNTSYGITCPYEDCFFAGKIEELEAMQHPVRKVARSMVSMDSPINSTQAEGQATDLHNFLQDGGVASEDLILMHQRQKKEFETLQNVINDQIAAIKRTNSEGTLIQKLLMYEAYKSMIERFPEEMVSYLVHEQQQEFNLQAKVFQTYADMVADYLPFSIQKKDEIIDILDLTDPDLALFEGISVFNAEVETDYLIPNRTQETYTGGRKHKNYGPSFIGKIIDVKNRKSGESLLSKVADYDFVKIKMSDDVAVGTPVTVQHFRIKPHYEMDSMVFLQRIRRQIVDSVYLRLNKKHRVPRANTKRAEA